MVARPSVPTGAIVLPPPPRPLPGPSPEPTQTPAATATPVPTPAPTSTPVAPILVTTERATPAVGSTASVLPPSPVTRFEAIDPAAGPLTAGVASGALEVRAGSAQAIGDTVLRATGTGCVQDEVPAGR